ncbi:hypothetical protein VNO77_41286 [Canavalia gladiata]|uniref:Transcription factor MYC/MYB N-terminal domain-containing protein n=1 Tax=Canavalia gladiata TaxID=3824 RepID=A0AAN9K0Z7_CANGL
MCTCIWSEVHGVLSLFWCCCMIFLSVLVGISNASLQNQMVPENLKKQLALAGKTIRWSYAIFWSVSDIQPSLIHFASNLDCSRKGLELGEGYYNGNIKTRKTGEVVELNSDQIGLQRSEQLQELHASLKSGKVSSKTKRPSAALSPEDLTDAE